MYITICFNTFEAYISHFSHFSHILTYYLFILFYNILIETKLVAISPISFKAYSNFYPIEY